METATVTDSGVDCKAKLPHFEPRKSSYVVHNYESVKCTDERSAENSGSTLDRCG